MDTKIKATTVVEQVMEQMKELITSGAYSAGDRLPPEGDLAKEWGVSRSSIREAVKVFNYLGVLESHAGRGTFICERTHISSSALSLVALLGSEESNEILDMRVSLELWCILQLTASYAAKETKALYTIADLDALTVKMEHAPDQKALIDLDISFHETLINFSGNSLFMDVFKILRNFTYDLDTIVHSHFDAFSEISSIHSEMVSYIKNNDLPELITCVKKHHAQTIEKFGTKK